MDINGFKEVLNSHSEINGHKERMTLAALRKVLDEETDNYAAVERIEAIFRAYKEVR